MVNDIWISQLPATTDQLSFSQMRPWNSASSPLSPGSHYLSMLIGSLSHSWHRLLCDVRRQAIFLPVSWTYSPCHETRPHLIRHLNLRSSIAPLTRTNKLTKALASFYAAFSETLAQNTCLICWVISTRYLQQLFMSISGFQSLTWSFCLLWCWRNLKNVMILRQVLQP